MLNSKAACGTRRTATLTLVFTLAFLCTANTCAPGSETGDEAELPTQEIDGLDVAQGLLENHDLRGARDAYRAALEKDGDSGEPLAGLAMLRLLLLPEHPTVSQLLLDGLPMGYSEKLRIKFGIDHFGYR